MNANGSGVTRIIGGSNPSWSPDGQRLAYNAPAPGELSVLTMANETTVQLTFDSCLKFSGVGGINDPDCPYSVVHNHSPSWSPDGQVIAFRKVQGTSSGVWLINADGSDERVLVNAPHANHIDWAPDGQRLAYSDHSDSIQIVNRDGSGWHVVPNTRQCVPGNCFVLQHAGHGGGDDDGQG